MRSAAYALGLFIGQVLSQVLVLLFLGFLHLKELGLQQDFVVLLLVALEQRWWLGAVVLLLALGPMVLRLASVLLA